MREPELVGWRQVVDDVCAKVYDSFDYGVPVLIHCVGLSGAGHSRLIRAVYQSIAVNDGWPPLETEATKKGMELLRSEIMPPVGTSAPQTALLYFPITIAESGQSAAALTQAGSWFEEYLAKQSWSAALGRAVALEGLRRVAGQLVDPPRAVKVLIEFGKSAQRIHAGGRPDDLGALTLRVSSDRAAALRQLAQEHSVLVCVQGGVVDRTLVSFLKQLTQRSRGLKRTRIAVLVTSPDPNNLLAALRPNDYRLPLLNRADAELLTSEIHSRCEVAPAEAGPGMDQYAPRDLFYVALYGEDAAQCYEDQLERLHRKHPERASATALLLASGWTSNEPLNDWPLGMQQLMVPALEGLDWLGWSAGRWNRDSGWPAPRPLQRQGATIFISHRPDLCAELNTLTNMGIESSAVLVDLDMYRSDGPHGNHLRAVRKSSGEAVDEAIVAFCVPWLPRALWYRAEEVGSLAELFDVPAVEHGLEILGWNRGLGGMTNGPFVMPSPDEQYACQALVYSDRSLTARFEQVLERIVALRPKNTDEAISLIAACQQVTGAPPWRTLGLCFQVLFDEGLATELEGLAPGFGSHGWQRSASSACQAVSALIRHDFMSALKLAQQAAEVLVAEVEQTSNVLDDAAPFVGWLSRVHIMSGTFHPSLEWLLGELWERRDTLSADDRSVTRRYLRASLRWRAGRGGRSSARLSELATDTAEYPAEDRFLQIVERQAMGEEAPTVDDLRELSSAMLLSPSENELRRLTHEAANDQRAWYTVFYFALQMVQNCDSDRELADLASDCVASIMHYLRFNVFMIGDPTWPSRPDDPPLELLELVDFLQEASAEVNYDSVTSLRLAGCAMLLDPSAKNRERVANAVRLRLASDPVDRTKFIREAVRQLLRSNTHRGIGVDLVRQWWLNLEIALDLAGPRVSAEAIELGWSLLADEANLKPRERRALAKRVCPRTFGWLMTAVSGRTLHTGNIAAWPDSFDPPRPPPGIRLE